MPKYQETIETFNRVCPYCNNSYQVESEDYSETIRVEECDKCGKKYHAYEIFSIDHYAKPDCELNAQEHIWEPVKLHSGDFHNFCSICDKCQIDENT